MAFSCEVLLKSPVTRRTFIASLGAIGVVGGTVSVHASEAVSNEAFHSPYPWPNEMEPRTTVISQDLQRPITSKPRVFTVPGKDYAQAVNQFYVEFRDHFKHKIPYPIGRLFQLFPINIVEGGTPDLLIQRGNLAFSQASVSNTGDAIDATFGDRTLGRLSISFPASIDAKLTSPSPGTFVVDFSKAPIAVVLFDIDAKYRILTNQQLTTISFAPNLVSYEFFALNDPGARLKIDVDLTKSPPQPSKAPPAQPKVASLLPISMGLGFFSGDPDKEFHPGYFGPFQCDCCGGYSDSKTQPRSPSDPNELTLYADCMCQAPDGSYRAFFVNNPFWTQDGAKKAVGKTAHFILSRYCDFESPCKGMQELGPNTNLKLKITQTSVSTGVYYSTAIYAS